MIETTIGAIRLSTVLLGQLLYTTDLKQEGHWYYDPLGSATGDNTGTVLVSAGGQVYKRIYTGPVIPEWFGAVCDGVTDSTVAIKRLIPFSDIEFSVGLGYAVNDTITFPNTIRRLIMHSPLIYTGNLNVPLLVIGESGKGLPLADLKINVRRKDLSDWTSEESIGVTVINANTSTIQIINASRFTIGARFIGIGAGFVYNSIFLTNLFENKIHLDLTNKSSVANDIGWCNENIFMGGKFAGFSSTNKGKSRYGVRISSMDGTYTNNNNNVFLKPSFELRFTASDPAEAIPILIINGNNNTFKDIRNEDNSPVTARISNESTENEITTGFGNVVVEDFSSYPNTRKVSSRQKLLTEANNVIYNSGSLSRLAVLFNGIDSVNVPGLFVGSSSNANVQIAVNGIAIDENYLEINSTRGIGLFVDSDVSKQFIVRRGVKDGQGGRVNIRCYDASGMILNNTGPGHPYVKSAVYMVLTYVSSFGGVYRTGTDSGSDVLFQVGPEVKYFSLIFSGGTQPAKINSFSITSVDGRHPTVWSGLDELGYEIGVATMAPSTGSWKKGKRVLNFSASLLGEPEGWMCIADGSPGTWAPFGKIGNVSNQIAIQTGNSTDVVNKVFLNTNYPLPDYPIGTTVSYYNQGKEYRRETATEWSVKTISLIT